jgi:hypothetical protein
MKLVCPIQFQSYIFVWLREINLRNFSLCNMTSYGDYSQPPVQWALGSICPCIKESGHFHLVLRLRMCGAIHLFPQVFMSDVSLSIWTWSLYLSYPITLAFLGPFIFLNIAFLNPAHSWALFRKLVYTMSKDKLHMKFLFNKEYVQSDGSFILCLNMYLKT